MTKLTTLLCVVGTLRTFSVMILPNQDSTVARPRPVVLLRNLVPTDQHDLHQGQRQSLIPSAQAPCYEEQEQRGQIKLLTDGRQSLLVPARTRSGRSYSYSREDVVVVRRSTTQAVCTAFCGRRTTVGDAALSWRNEMREGLSHLAPPLHADNLHLYFKPFCDLRHSRGVEGALDEKQDADTPLEDTKYVVLPVKKDGPDFDLLGRPVVVVVDLY
mmetsp:Transcript_22259/g.56211  ORF Transcript_22259/g.56211 Transcript_22259/m.56211 type:complete len:215 (-) Transcript_22259:213-857(-)